MSRKTWKLEYFTPSRKETSLHATREMAMNVLYSRLDLEQRDALTFEDQAQADRVGKIRGQMASSWHYATHSKVAKNPGAIVWQCDLAKITRA